MHVELKAMRVKRGLTQTDIAKKLNMATSTYNVKENGIREFSESEIIQLLLILQCDFSDIFLINK